MTDLKIEAGKCYRTRDGRKAYVVYAGPTDDTLKGLVQHEHGPILHCWYPEGCIAPPQGKQNHDLISEWKEPRKGEVWVNVYAYEDGTVAVYAHDSKEDADGCGGDRTALLGPIPWTEGEGLTSAEHKEG